MARLEVKADVLSPKRYKGRRLTLSVFGIRSVTVTAAGQPLGDHKPKSIGEVSLRGQDCFAAIGVPHDSIGVIVEAMRTTQVPSIDMCVSSFRYGRGDVLSVRFGEFMPDPV